MARLSAEAELQRLLQHKLPAVKTAGSRFSPVAGLTGESWRIESADGVVLLARQQGAEKAALGVNRRREARVLRRSAGALGPRPLAQDRRWLVVEWLDGASVSPQAFERYRQGGELAALIAALHRRPRSGYRLNLPAQYLRYWQQLDRRRITPAWLRLQRYFQQTPPPRPLKLAPLHMDIHPENLIEQQTRLRLIDWEYAGDGDVALELAALFRFNQWSAAAQWEFLQQYAGQGYRDPAALSRQVRRWLPWVDYLMLMWFEVRWQQSGDAQFLRCAAALRRRFCL